MTKMRLINQRFHLAKKLSRFFPLFVAHIPATFLYPWRFGQQEQNEVIIKSITGSKIKVNTSDEYGYYFSLLGYYEWKLLVIAMTVCKKGDTIIEIGANVGTETVGFADIVGDIGRVISFEPVPDNLFRLKESVSLSGLMNVTIEPLAVSDSVGKIDFVFPDGSNSGIGHIDYGTGYRPGRKLTVNTTTLDKYLVNQKARLLMMDVEGAELRVLRGGKTWISENRPVIIVEAHHDKQEMYEYFVEQGYTVYSIERLGLRKPQTDPEISQYNWLAIHKNESDLAKKIDRSIKLSGLLPSVKYLQPLASVLSD